MNLHLCGEENFIEHSIKIFERFYPANNSLVLCKKTKECYFDKNIPIFRVKNLSHDELNNLLIFCQQYYVENIILHGMSKAKTKLLLYLKSKNAYSGKVYWIFWGYEMYNALGEMGRYKLVDTFNIFSAKTYYVPNRISRFIRFLLQKNSFSQLLPQTLPYVDYFCFWLYSDYELLKNNFKTHATYKSFRYLATNKEDIIKNVHCYDKQIKTIMVNHQASMTGNHDTVFNKLKSLNGINDYNIIVPLSYGSNLIKKEVIQDGKIFFKDKFIPMTTLLPEEEYTKFLSTIPVAVFGQLRQEASGNIKKLLVAGAKVFLRNGNPLLEFYRKLGYKVFSFEDDLNSVEDLRPLTLDEQIHNESIATATRVDYEDFMISFFD